MNEKLNAIIKKAQGERSQNAYASECGVSSATLTRILKGQLNPSIGFLKKLSLHAHGFVTYMDFMKAANYMPIDKESDIPNEVAFIARRIETMTEEDKEQLYKIFNSTIDTFDCKYNNKKQ